MAENSVESDPAASDGFTTDVVVIGGCGRVGLPLGIALASRGLTVTLYDINTEAVDTINNGTMPFQEDQAQPLLTQTLTQGLLTATTNPHSITTAESVIVVVGTPVDEHLSPDLGLVPNTIKTYLPHLRNDQLLILRSTVHPGVTALVEKLLTNHGLTTPVAFCPERIAEGNALTELFTLPQIIASRTPQGTTRAEKLFGHLTDQTITLTPEEAELAKLFTNTWRYIKFATANQFWMMANDAGLDYQNIQHAITHNYPRAADVPMPGFAAGPCLLKDTMQLAAFNKNNFILGHTAMLINEGLPLYLISRLENHYPLHELTVGILGMSFKANSDDPRQSLAFKLRKLLRTKADTVLATDPHLDDPRLHSLDYVLQHSDLLIIAAPHTQYRNLTYHQPVIDIWGILGNGVHV